MDAIFVAMTANLNSSKVRRVMRGGEEYLVASGSSINPGVLSGSKGPLLYPAEEASRNVADWDGMPMVVYHPITSAGQHVSANHPGVKERQQIGHIEASRFDGKLRHEHWFKVSSLRNAKAGDPFKDAKQTIYDRLMRNQPIETSTGLYTDNEPSPGICPKTGRHYNAVARNYRPDHLAVLPDQIGACSVNDGCGVLVNANPEGHNQYTGGGKVGDTVYDADSNTPGKIAKISSDTGTHHVSFEDSDSTVKYSKADIHRGALHKSPPLRNKSIESNSSSTERPTMDNLSFLQKILGVLTGTSHSDVSVVANADQGRHPRDGTYQGKAGNSAKAGYSNLDAKRQQVGPGNQEAGTSGRDGRNVDLTKRVADTFQHHDGKGNDADDDSDDDGQLVDSPDLKVKADKKVGSQSAQVSVNESFEEDGTSPMLITNMWSDAARAAALEARRGGGGTQKQYPTASQTPNQATDEAVKVGKQAEKKGTAKSHFQAASFHRQAADQQLSAGNTELAAHHQAAAKAHRDVGHAKVDAGDKTMKGFGVPARNESFEEGGTSPMYAGDQQSNPAHVASKQAAAASVGTEQGDARDAALGAVDASKDQDHDAAADGHVGAAKLHEKAAVGALKDKDPQNADDHMRAAALHRKAAMLHSATMNEENAMLTANKDFTSDAERKAAFAAMADDGGSKSAVAASAHANKTGTAGAHSKAAAAHREAAEHHKDEGNSELAGMHKKAEYGHRQKASKLTKNQLIPASIIANCGCEETRQRLLQLNAKAEGSNADVSGSGEVQAGGEDDADDHDYDSDDSGYAGKAESAVKGKKNMQTKVGAAMNMRQWEASMPAEAREVWNSAKQTTQQTKAGLARQLVVNIGDPGRRQARFRHYMQKSPTELRDLVADLGVAYNRREEAVENELEPLYLGAAAPVGNGSYDSQPDVDDVIPIRNCIGDIVREAAEAKA